MRRTTTYQIDGRLPSGCIHICSISRDVAKRLMRFRSGVAAKDARFFMDRGVIRIMPLTIATSKHLHRGYRYVETRLWFVKEG